MKKIELQITDQITGKDVVCQVSIHDAQKLQRALREILGDIQYQAKPGELITLPNMGIQL